MKQILRILSILAFLLLAISSFALDETKRNILILNFKNLSGSSDYNYLSQFISSSLETKLRNTPYFNVVSLSENDLRVLERIGLTPDNFTANENESCTYAIQRGFDIMIMGSYLVEQDKNSLTIFVEAYETKTILARMAFKAESNIGVDMFLTIDKVSDDVSVKMKENFPPPESSVIYKSTVDASESIIDSSINRFEVDLPDLKSVMDLSESEYNHFSKLGISPQEYISKKQKSVLMSILLGVIPLTNVIGLQYYYNDLPGWGIISDVVLGFDLFCIWLGNAVATAPTANFGDVLGGALLVILGAALQFSFYIGGIISSVSLPNSINNNVKKILFRLDEYERIKNELESFNEGATGSFHVSTLLSLSLSFRF